MCCCYVYSFFSLLFFILILASHFSTLTYFIFFVDKVTFIIFIFKLKIFI